MGGRRDWQRTDLISRERETELRAVLADRERSSDMRWAGFSPLGRPDVEWLLINQRQIRTYLIEPDLGPLPLCFADLRKADLSDLPLDGCDLSCTLLSGANLANTQLAEANLEYSQLRGAHLEGADLRGAWLARADLRGAWFDQRTVLTGAHLFDVRMSSPVRSFNRSVRLAGVRWNEADVSGIADLDEFRRLGDDLIPWLERFRYKLRPSKFSHIKRQVSQMEKLSGAEHYEYVSDAVAAYRQFATVLRTNGLPNVAVRCEYRARQLGRQVRARAEIRRSRRSIDRRKRYADEILDRRRKSAEGKRIPLNLVRRCGRIFGWWLDHALRHSLAAALYYCTWVASFLLDLICGYGYKPLRVLATYLVVVLAFAGIYAIYPPRPDTPHGWNTIWFSMIAFHGRGVISGDIRPDSGMLWVPAFEAVIGLGVEALLVASIIRRLFRD